MNVTNIDKTEPFVTKDGSTIRELHHTDEQSLAEATLEPGQATERHYHRAAEEIYFVLKGSGRMEVDGDARMVRPGDAVLIPPGAWHRLENTCVGSTEHDTSGGSGLAGSAAKQTGSSELRILCCCSPPYSHDDTFFE